MIWQIAPRGWRCGRYAVYRNTRGFFSVYFDDGKQLRQVCMEADSEGSAKSAAEHHHEINAPVASEAEPSAGAL